MTTRIDQLPNAEVIAWPTDSGRYRSGVADGASAVGHIFDTANTLANAAARLLSLRNNTAEKFGVLADGSLLVSGIATRFGPAGTSDANADTRFVASAATKKSLVLQFGHATPTADLLQAQMSDGTPCFRIQSDGGAIIDQRTGATFGTVLDVKYQGNSQFSISYLGDCISKSFNFNGTGGGVSTTGDVNGRHLRSGIGTSPTVSDNGGNNSTIAGKDSALAITVGTGTVTQITVTYGVAWATAPAVSVSASTSTDILVTRTTGGFVLTRSGGGSFTNTEVLLVVSIGF